MTFQRLSCASVSHALRRNHPSRIIQQKRLLAVQTLDDEESVASFASDASKSVLYFTAKWCGPCQQIKPVYEELSIKHPDVSFGKVDIDENGDAAASHDIRVVPTFIFSSGQSTNRMEGADPVTLEAKLKEL